MTTDSTYLTEETTVCPVHPQMPTSLRCNQCERLMCSRCAVLTPTGYRCKECISGRQKVYETSLARDYLLSIPIAAVLGLIGSIAVLWVGFYMLFVAPVAGSIIAEVVRFVSGKRRSKKLFYIAAGSVAAGCIPMGLLLLITGYWSGLLWLGLYATLATSTVYYRLSGISLKF
jgi:uncharacterized membrane protein